MRAHSPPDPRALPPGLLAALLDGVDAPPRAAEIERVRQRLDVIRLDEPEVLQAIASELLALSR